MRLRTDPRALYMLGMCHTQARLSPDLKTKHGAVLTLWEHDLVTGVGYNHPVGTLTCETCPRQMDRSIQSGQRLELCHAVHAEQAAILNAATLGNVPRCLPVSPGDYKSTIWDLGVDAASNNVIQLPEPMFSCTFCVRIMAEFGVTHVCVYVQPCRIWELTIQEAIESAYEYAQR